MHNIPLHAYVISEFNIGQILSNVRSTNVPDSLRSNPMPTHCQRYVLFERMPLLVRSERHASAVYTAECDIPQRREAVKHFEETLKE